MLSLKIRNEKAKVIRYIWVSDLRADDGVMGGKTRTRHAAL